MSGDIRKIKGQKQVEANSGGWVKRMREVAVDICVRKGSVTSDDLRRYMLRNSIPPPHHPNAWGGIFRGKVEGMRWIEIGRVKSMKRTNNGRKISVWTLG